MKRQVIVTDWKNGQPPRVAYEDHGPTTARSRAPSSLEGGSVQGGVPGERGGRVKKSYAGLGQSSARS